MISFNSSENSNIGVATKHPLKFERSKVMIEFCVQWQVFPSEKEFKRGVNHDYYDNMKFIVGVGPYAMYNFSSSDCTKEQVVERPYKQFI